MEASHQELLVAIAFGIHKGVEKKPELQQKLCEKDVTQLISSAAAFEYAKDSKHSHSSDEDNEPEHHSHAQKKYGKRPTNSWSALKIQLWDFSE